VKGTFAVVLVAVMLAGPACGGGNGGNGNGNPANPSPNPQDPAFQTLTGTVGSFEYVSHPLTTSRSGNLTITLTWQGSGDLDLYLTAGNCPDIYNANACARLAGSDQIVGNSESLTRAVQSGEQFKIWVDNFALVSQAYTLTIDIR
jgi:hypothetical protein